MNRRSLRASGATVAVAALLLTMLAITPAAAGPRKIGFSSSTYSVTEGDGTATITISRTSTRGAASIIFYTGPSSSATTVDFAPATATTVSFAAGESTVTVPITIKVDKVTGEGDETVPLVLSTPSKGYKLGTSSATLTIHEMPFPPTPTLAAPVVNGPTSISLSWSIPADPPSALGGSSPCTSPPMARSTARSREEMACTSWSSPRASRQARSTGSRCGD